MIDRFVLFKYDDVNFNDAVFTNAPQSTWTGDEVVVANLAPPIPDQNIDVNAETDSTSAETDNTNIDDPDSQVPAPTPQYQVPAN